jgi:hypothetical protein
MAPAAFAVDDNRARIGRLDPADARSVLRIAVIKRQPDR